MWVKHIFENCSALQFGILLYCTWRYTATTLYAVGLRLLYRHFIPTYRYYIIADNSIWGYYFWKIFFTTAAAGRSHPCIINYCCIQRLCYIHIGLRTQPKRYYPRGSLYTVDLCKVSIRIPSSIFGPEYTPEHVYINIPIWCCKTGWPTVFG